MAVGTCYHNVYTIYVVIKLICFHLHGSNILPRINCISTLFLIHIATTTYILTCAGGGPFTNMY